ncbi:UBX domain-containing protein 11 [Pelodytes ibericus]
MSSPLVTLGRHKKTGLLPVNRTQPRQRGEISSRADLQESWPHLGRKMSDCQGISGKQTDASDLPGNGRRLAPFKDYAGHTGSVPSDFDLLSATMKRISELERCVLTQERDIHKKDLEIATLEQKIKRLQRPKTGVKLFKSQELETKCQKLQQQVCEMERFLNDYGLVWVGEDDSTSASKHSTKTWKPGHSLTTFEPDFDLIIRNLQDLNILGGEGKSRIEYREGGARLKSPESIPLILYSNGIIMFQGPFRLFQEASTQQCLQDIMDGYFPAELQSRFPDGVTFQVTDKRNVVFQQQRSWDEFPNSGQTVGNTKSKMQETSELPGPQLSMDQFLNKLPKSVVRGGRVLDIRGPVREALQETGVQRLMEIQVDSPLLGSEENRYETNSLSTLRIKSESGEHTYKVRMLPSETLGDLRMYLSQCRDSHLPSYEIIGRFPYRVYDDDSCTLQELGLVPNAFLLLRTKGLKTTGGGDTPRTHSNLTAANMF